MSLNNAATCVMCVLQGSHKSRQKLNSERGAAACERKHDNDIVI